MKKQKKAYKKAWNKYMIKMMQTKSYKVKDKGNQKYKM